MTLQALQNNNTVVIGNLEMAIVLIRAEFLAKSVQAGTLNKFSKAGLESQGPSVLSDHCNAEITQCAVVEETGPASVVMYCQIPRNVLSAPL